MVHSGWRYNIIIVYYYIYFYANPFPLSLFSAQTIQTNVRIRAREKSCWGLYTYDFLSWLASNSEKISLSQLLVWFYQKFFKYEKVDGGGVNCWYYGYKYSQTSFLYNRLISSKVTEEVSGTKSICKEL